MTDSSDKATVMPRDNGPYFVLGDVDLLDAEGNPIAYEGRMALCRCGHSGTKPICDGSHRETGFASLVRG